MPVTNKYEKISRDLLLRRRCDSLSILDDEGWIPINHVVKLDFVKKFEDGESIVLATGHGAGSIKDAPVYEIDGSQTRFRCTKRSPGKSADKETIIFTVDLILHKRPMEQHEILPCARHIGIEIAWSNNTSLLQLYDSCCNTVFLYI